MLAPISGMAADVAVVAATGLAPWFEPTASVLVLDWVCGVKVLACAPVTPPVEAMAVEDGIVTELCPAMLVSVGALAVLDGALEAAAPGVLAA